MCARRRSNFFHAEKSHQKWLTLLSATPSLRYGATCAGALAGCAVELTSQLRSNNHGERGPADTVQGDHVAPQRGCMQGARAQQGRCLASAGNVADGPFARQPEGKLTRARPSALRSLSVRTHALRRAPWWTGSGELRDPLHSVSRPCQRSMRAPARMPPRKYPAAGASTRAGNPTGLFCARPGERGSLSRGAHGFYRAERSNGPEGCLSPCGRAEKRSVGRIRARVWLSTAGASW